MESHQRSYRENVDVCMNRPDKRSLIEASYNWLCFTACRLGIKMSTVTFELGFEIGIAADNQMENKDD